ncbi:unnamed protein product [Porites lobata]|uniref:SUEL-type lectin domain-containing protein n=1 Tax=Porites lobata TaxID=104759 RepID=A0ABN8QPY7_9CNID|nr:unnamed protein product [Porites lobata]
MQLQFCEGDSHTLSCAHFSKNISILSANYGRLTGAQVCGWGPIKSTHCKADGALAKVQAHCQGRSHCTLRATNSEFGDPCDETYKYLEVTIFLSQTFSQLDTLLLNKCQFTNAFVKIERKNQFSALVYKTPFCSWTEFHQHYFSELPHSNQPTFHYDSHHWSTYGSKYPQNGTTGFDDKETKLETYDKTSFTKICLGMKVESQTRFIVINKKAKSLYELISKETYEPTTLGRDEWKKLVGPQASLQNNCEREGFNAKGDRRFFYLSRARIGIIGNQEDNCDSPDSRIGFGTGGQEKKSTPRHKENTCGNEAHWSSDNRDQSIKAMGYILVQ